jgi:CheY-like chemotaxis protein
MLALKTGNSAVRLLAFLRYFTRLGLLFKWWPVCYPNGGKIAAKRFCMQKLAKVLLVDDDPIITFLHTQLLKRFLVVEQLLVAHNGVEALQTLAHTCAESDGSEEPILVLLDLNMPVMNGLQFLETYQQHPLAQQCRVVLVVLTTAEYSRDLERIRALAITADILTKPLTQEKVETLLHRHFQRDLSA